MHPKPSNYAVPIGFYGPNFRNSMRESSKVGLGFRVSVSSHPTSKDSP